MKKKIAVLAAIAVTVTLALTTISSAVVPTYGIVKGTEKQWAIAQCFNGTTEYPCAEQWIFGSGTENPGSGMGSNGDIFWRTDLQTFSAKSGGVWATFERAARIHPVSPYSLRQTTGIPLVAAETAGNFDIDVAANVTIAGGEITDNETEVSVANFQFALPENYVSGGAVTVSLPVAIIKTGGATNNGSSIDVLAYEQAVGAVGADLCTTAAQTFVALDTWYSKDFVITPTNLVAGDVLNIYISSSVIDSEAGGGTLRMNLDAPKLLLDVR